MRPSSSPSAAQSSHAASNSAVAELDDVADDLSSDVEPAAHLHAVTAAVEAAALSPAPVATAAQAATHAAPQVTNATWIPHESGDIRGVLIQVGGGRLLLPNATIAEVLSYAEPEPVESSADWLLGRFRWRGWQLPLVAFSRLAGIGEEQPGLGSKVIVLKALGGDRRIPYFAILTQGFPRLVTVSRSALEVEADDDALPEAIQARVRLNDEPALLPDLLRIEHMLQADREAA